MVGERTSIAQWHNLACIFPRTCGRGSGTVGDMFGHTTGSIEQLIYTITLGEPWTLYIRILILFSLLALTHDRTTKSLFGHIQTTQFTAIGNHIAIQLQVVALRVTPHQPCLTIIINHHRGVDMIPRAILEEGLTKGILERTCRTVAHSHTDGHTTREFAMCTDIPIVLTVALYRLTGPRTVVSPRETLQSQWRTMVGPVHHILGRINAPLLHPEEIGIILIMSSINIHPVTAYHWCGVACKPSLHKGVLCLSSHSSQCHHGCTHHSLFHFLVLCIVILKSCPFCRLVFNLPLASFHWNVMREH